MNYEIDFKLIFSKKNFNKYFKFLLILVSLILILKLSFLYYIYQDRLDSYIERTNKIIYADGVDLTLICVTNNCEKIYYKIDNSVFVYANDENLLKECKKFPDKINHNILSKDFRSIVTIAHDNYVIKLIIDDNENMKEDLIVLSYNVFIEIMIFTIIFYSYIFQYERYNFLKKKEYLKDIEDKLQKNLGESAHHDMLLPIAIIKTSFSNLMLKLYPCPQTGQKCALITEDKMPRSINCPCNSHSRDIDTLARTYNTKIMSAIERLEESLNQMAANKHAKYNIDNKPLLNNINEAVNAINSFNVKKLKLFYDNTTEDILNTYTLSNTLSNPALMNIINNHLTNSNEARANNIKIKAVERDDGKLDLYIADDGTGIRDEHGDIINLDDIFKNGYSTKDVNGKPIVKKKKWYEMFFNVVKINEAEQTYFRGYGLYNNKQVLNKSDGDVILVKTSKYGTVFKLTIPVVLRSIDD